jgi:hypothetical protein
MAFRLASALLFRIRTLSKTMLQKSSIRKVLLQVLGVCVYFAGLQSKRD